MDSIQFTSIRFSFFNAIALLLEAMENLVPLISFVQSIYLRLILSILHFKTTMQRDSKLALDRPDDALVE